MTTVTATPSTSTMTFSFQDVFGADAVTLESEPFFTFREPNKAITYFVGRNGSGKSKLARIIATRHPEARILSTDRLVGLMKFTSYQWGAMPQDYPGVPLDEQSRPQIVNMSRKIGTATEDLYALREQPETWLRVAAFLRRALHRSIELRESAGFLDPYVRIDGVEYSLLRDEGHGLREIVVLLSAVYRRDWRLLIVDEPELHLHPSLARLWIGELEAECAKSGRRAIIITHEPTMLRPASVDDLSAIWLFQPGRRPISLIHCVRKGTEARVAASLVQNPQLVSQLVFSPRPVLLEGALDVVALNTALRRSQPAEVIAQTDLVDCGGNGGMAVWFAVARHAGIDVRAVGDLDCVLDPAVTSTLDTFPDVTSRYQSELYIEPPKTSTVVRPLIEQMRTTGVPTDQKSRAAWMTTEPLGGNAARRDKLLEIWRDANLWLHSQGTLESVLGLAEEDKSRERIREAAGQPGAIDAVAQWCAFSLDPSGDVFELLSVAVERMAHALLEALRLSPETRFHRPVGSAAVGDARLADVSFLESTNKHRITVRLPEQFAGFWVEFDRDTPPSQIVLQPPR
jgi:predicted ATPase